MAGKIEIHPPTGVVLAGFDGKQYFAHQVFVEFHVYLAQNPQKSP